MVISLEYLEKYNFQDIFDFFDHLLEMRSNGSERDLRFVRVLINKMSSTQYKKFIIYIKEIAHDDFKYFLEWRLVF